MANVLNKTSDPVDYRTSVNTPAYPAIDWFINPDISAVVGVDKRYWKRPLTDPVAEMTAGEKAAVDAAEQSALVTRNRSIAVSRPDDVADAKGWETRALIELLNKRDNYLTNRIIELQDRVQAMLDSTGVVDNMRTDGLAVSISATATRTRADAIQDYKDDINAGGADT